MTMTKNGSNGGGRIAYASRAAAQLLGLGGIPSPSPKKAKHARSPQMNHPIQLKFSSNKQPLFPRRRASDSYSEKYALRPHSTNNTNSNNNYVHPSRPVSLPVTPIASGQSAGAGYPSTFNSNNQMNQTTNALYRSPAHRSQLRMSQHASSYNNLSRTHHQPLIHPRSAHNVPGPTSPIKALPNSNILNMGSKTMSMTMDRDHRRQTTNHSNQVNQQMNQQMKQPMNPLTSLSATYSGPKLRRHLSASAASTSGNHRVGTHSQNHFNRGTTGNGVNGINHANRSPKHSHSLRQHQRGVVRPHSYSPTKSNGITLEDLNIPQNMVNAPTESVTALTQSNPFQNSSGKQNASNIRVVLRVRPLSDSERRDRCSYSIKRTADRAANSILVQKLKKDGSIQKEKQFTFDKICHEDTQQAQFYDVCGVKNLVEAALNGYAATMFAYGQTGSGKTYTVCGENESIYEDDRDSHLDMAPSGNSEVGVHQLSGIIPRTIMDLWTKMEALSADPQSRKQYVIRAGYLEIYNERPRDLLNPHFQNLSVRWNSESGFFVENQCIVRCESAQDLLAVFNEGELNRQTGSHEMNSQSSRSHCLFTMHVESRQQVNAQNNGQIDEDDSYIQNGKISIVDLAGSEKLKDSKQVTDKGLRETANINRSLFTLGKVISTLEKVQSKELAASTYIPYRDSVLTKLLMDSLGGSGMALMVACVSPANVYVEETLSTLYYASRARNIQNVPTKKINAKDRIIAQLIQEVQRLKTENLRMKHYILKCANPNALQGTISNGTKQVQQPINGSNEIQQPINGQQRPISNHQHQQQAIPQRTQPIQPMLHHNHHQQPLSRQQRPHYLTQSQPVLDQNTPMNQEDRPQFSWEMSQQNRNLQQSSHSNLGNSRAVLHPLSQQQPQAVHQQQLQQEQQPIRTKPPLLHGYSSPIYQAPQQQVQMEQEYQNQIETLQAAKESAEQDASKARQENNDLMDKIEHLETVFMR